MDTSSKLTTLHAECEQCRQREVYQTLPAVTAGERAHTCGRREGVKMKYLKDVVFQ
jgi:hypothetical protein